MISKEELTESAINLFNHCNNSRNMFTCLNCPIESISYPFALSKLNKNHFQCDIDINNLKVISQFCEENCHCDRLLELNCKCPARGLYRKRKMICALRRLMPIYYDRIFAVPEEKEFD